MLWYGKHTEGAVLNPDYLKRTAMKKILFLTLLTVLLAGVPGGVFSQKVSYTPVNFDPSVKYQTMVGWGASLAFYEGWLTAHPKKAEIYDVIFKELSLDILRVRNAYGYDNTMIGRVKEFNQAAQKSLGHPIDILTTSWGPPASLKSNNDKNNGGTLKYTVSDGKVNFNYAGFARWWNQSLDDYNKNGVYPKYVSIQNEPDFKADYESCLLNPSETFNATDTIAGYNKALDAVYDTLQKRSHIPLFLGPECVGIGYFGQTSNGVERYVNALDINKLYGIAHHLYHGTDEENPWSSADFGKMGKYRPQIPHFQTEYSRGKWFPLSGMIYKSLNDENAVAYFFWDLVWPDGGLVDIDFPWDVNQWTDKSKGYQRTKHYWVFKQFSAWIHPGWTRVKVNAPSVMVKNVAFLSADGDSATLVAINTSASTSYGLKAAIPGYAIDEMVLTRTSATEDGVNLTMPSDSILITPQSITTIAMKISEINTSTHRHLLSGTGAGVVTLFPNPLRNGGTLRFSTTEKGIYSLNIFDLRGSLMLSQPLGTLLPGEQTIGVHRQNLPAGSYLFRVDNNGREAGRGKFTVAE